MTKSRTRVHFIVLFGVALLGCHRHRGDVGIAGGPQATDRQVRNAVSIAARDMQCPEQTLSAQQIGESLYTVHGCGRSREYLLLCAGRRRACRWSPVIPVEQVAASETGCTTFTITEPSLIERAVSGCNQTSMYMIGCNVAACAWGHAAGGGGAVVQSAPPPQATTTTTTTVATGSMTLPTSDPQSALMNLASDRWTQAQACLNGQHVDATLTLGVDGRVSAVLDDPLHGTPAEACVQGVVGDVSVSMTGQTAPVTVMLTL